MGADKPEERRLIIGLDYGTTYTGVAFADSSQTNIDNITVISSWPGKAAANNEKVPSQIAYNESGIGYSWGNKIPRGAKRHYWTKLELDKQHSSTELRQMLALITGDMSLLTMADDDEEDENAPPRYPGRDAKDIVADYLRGVKEHVFHSVLADTYTQSILDTLPIEIILTCPAVWSDKAKDLTFAAATQAGFGAFRLSLLTEPEAAAVYSIKQFKEGLAGSVLKINDHFTVCDAGGGTVDLISYKVTALNPTLQMEEAAIGSGDKCGATFVDRSFQLWLKEKLGDRLYAQIPKGDMLIGGQIMNAFELIKRRFPEDDDDTVVETIRLPSTIPRDIERANVQDGEITLTSDDLESMFKPHVGRVIELLAGQNKQVRKTGSNLSTVFLVGGFSDSPYLYGKVKEWCDEEDIQLIRPLHPWSAIVRGAVARGLEGEAAGLVSLRICRRYYGTDFAVPFIDGVHIEEDKFIDKFTGETQARGQMHWMVKKHDILPVKKSKEATIACGFQFGKTGKRSLQVMLLECDEEEAPTRILHPDAKVVCKLTVDLSEVPTTKFLETNPGMGKEPYYTAKFQIALILTGAMLEFKCLFDGEEVGSVKASYT